MSRREIEIAVVEIALALACGIALLMVSGKVASGEQRKASSTSYAQDLKTQPRSYQRYKKYRYSYRRSRSRAAAVNSRAAQSVVVPASREVSLGGADKTLPPVGTPAGQSLLIGNWPAIALMPPYQKPFETIEPEPLAQWRGGEVMLEREGEEVPAPRGDNSLHLIALGAIAAVLTVFLFFAVIGEEHERQPATPQWPFGPDA